MPNRRKVSPGLIAAITASTMLLLCISVGALSYGHASRAAEQFEARIDAAKAAAAADTSVLRENLIAAAKLDTLADVRALHLAELAQQHPGPRGTRIVALELTEHSPLAAPLNDSLLASLDSTLKMHRKMSSKHRAALMSLQNEYNNQLSSPWVGRWMHLAGYPKSTTKKSAKLRPVPPSRVKTAPPAGAPVAYTPDRTE